MAKRQITVTLTQGDYEILRDRALAAGTTVPAFARVILLRDEIGVQAAVEASLEGHRTWLAKELVASEKRQSETLLKVAQVIVRAIRDEAEREKAPAALSDTAKEV